LSVQYYYADGDVQKGPFEKQDLAAQGVAPDTLVWREGLAEWQRAGSLAELKDAIGASPAPERSREPDEIPLAPEPARSAPGWTAPGGAAGYSPSPSYPQQPYAHPHAVPGYGQPTGYATPMGQPLAYGGYAPAGSGSPPAGMAIASMVLGILSIPMMFFYCTGTPCAILAIVFGHIARGRAVRQEGGGAGMALAGLICAYISVALMLALIVFFIVVFGIAAAGR
jgi:hypothetical protein